LRIAAGFQDPVPPYNTESATRIEAAANKTEFFDHELPSRCVDQNEEGHLAVDNRIVNRRSGVHHRTKRERTEKGRHVGDKRFGIKGSSCAEVGLPCGVGANSSGVGPRVRSFAEAAEFLQTNGQWKTAGKKKRRETKEKVI
jgi:hypothetical protein